MERLTEKIGSKYCLKHCLEENPCSETSGICLCGECSFPQKAHQKLGEYEDLEEQGKLLKLDFKYQRIMIGQEIFVVEDGAVKSKKICHINEWWNDYHGFQGEYAAIPSKGFGSWEFKYEDFDKTVFLIREEAESALKKMGW